MVSAANPFATRAGLEILRRGGSAVDAAIAVQMVLNVVEPQSSGIGGGAFLLHYDAADRAVQAYDGRETAPAAATPDLFLDSSGEPTWVFSGSGWRPCGRRARRPADARPGPRPAWRSAVAGAI